MMPGRRVAGVAALLVIGCAVARAAPLGYATPPGVGDRVLAQPLVLVCDAADAARYSARTGFVGRGCRQLGDDAGWRVAAVTHERIDDGGLWLVRVERADDETPRTAWIPLPWHDWA